MQSTPYTLATSIISNAPGVNSWLNPTNLFIVDDQYAVSSGPTNIVTIGNINLNVPQGSQITNFSIQVKGYIGTFNTTLYISAVDDTTGVTYTYPLAPFQGFSATNTLYTLPNSLFGTTWTVDQANNIKLQLIADGELHLDAVLISALYVPVVTPVPVPPSTGSVVVDEFVEAQPFQLAQSMTATDLYMFLESFNTPNGVPIQYTDFYGTEGCLVIDQGIPGKEEQVLIASVDQNYQSTGLCRIGFGSLNNRGLKFTYPYTSVPANIVNHDGTAQAVLSNDARFYNRFLKKNQINALVSAPIIVADENTPLPTVAHELDFRGAGVQATNDGVDPYHKIITIPGNGVNPPNVVSVSDTTSGASQVPTITWNHTSSGLNRLLVVQVETEAAQTITGVTFNGIALTQGVTITNGTLRNEQWYLVAPTVGTYPIVVTLSGSAYLTCGAETYNTVNQSSPIGVTQTATGTSLTPSLILTTGTDNSIVVDSLTTGTLPIVYTVGAGQSNNWSITSNPNSRQGASSVEPAGIQPDAVTMSWAITQSIPWAQTAMEIKGIGSPTPVTGIISINGDPTQVQTFTAGAGISITDNGTGDHLITNTGGAGTGDAMSEVINQVGHGFTVGLATAVRKTGASTYVGSLALKTSSTDLESEMIGLAVATTANAFTLYYGGKVPTSAFGALADNTPVYISDATPGLLTDVEPSAIGSVSKPVAYVNVPGTDLIMYNYRGLTNQTGTGSGTTTNGTTSKDASDASVVQTIPHGLGQIPSEVSITALCNSGTNQVTQQALTIYNGTTQSSASTYGLSGAPDVLSDATFSLNNGANPGIAYTRGVVTYDATNIYITWTKTNFPTGIYTILWKATSLGGGNSNYTVNADETVSTWWTTYLQAPFSGSTAQESFWTLSNTATPYSNGTWFNFNAADFGASAVLNELLTGSSQGQLQFGATTNLRIKGVAQLPAGTDVSGGGSQSTTSWGLVQTTSSGGQVNGDITNIVSRVCFGFYNGLIYAITADGASVTATSLGAYVAPVAALYEIVLTGITDAKFYINGILVHTETNTLPTGVNMFLDFYTRNAGGTSPGGGFVSSFTLSQQL